MMSMLFNRKVLIPVWISVVLGIFTLFGPPLTLATGSPLLFMAFAPPTILLILSTAPTLTLSEAIAEELRPADRSREAE
jgi:hypothetical protein